MTAAAFVEGTFYSGGNAIAATLHLPEGAARCPAVVLCNGFGGIKDLVLPDIADFLAARGIAVLRFDHRGFGASAGPKWHLIPMEQVEDIRNALTWLEADPRIDSQRMGLYGTSFGGANAIVTAALDPRVKVVATCVSVGNGKSWMRSLRRNWEWIEFQAQIEQARQRRVTTGETTWVDSDIVMPPDPESHTWHGQVIREFPERQYQLPLETAEKILEFAPDELVSRIAPRPVLFMMVQDDLLVANDLTVELFERCGEPKKLITLRDINHHDVYSGEPFRQTMSAAADWFRTHL